MLVLIINLTQPRIMGEESLNEGLSGCGMSVGDWLFSFFFLFLLCTGVLPTCPPVHQVHAWCLPRPEEGIALSGTGTPECCKAPCGCREERGKGGGEH